MKKVAIVVRFTIILFTLLTAGFAVATSCESLAKLSLPNTTVTLAQAVAAGEFVLPANQATLQILKTLPAFCRVAATLKPTDDSDIKIEVWMPASGWNGKFLAVGNGGWSGAISYPAMAQALVRGYATASTDTGHSGRSGSFALGHPEKLIDFGYRAVHEMTVKAKAVIAGFYDNPPKLSYWSGCSSGGKQGLKEAQRFPRDYDGIIAGAPANYWTHLSAGQIWVGQATLNDPAGFIPQAKYELIHKAALNACDELDEVKDGIIEDPTRCRFDPKALACSGEDGQNCLTTAQVEAARKIYAGPKNPRTGTGVFPGYGPGTELGWSRLAGGPKPFPIADDHFKYIVFKNADWDFHALNFDRDIALADRIDNGLINATDPNLKEFVGRGGKLLLYHGWSDASIPAQNTVDYYKSVANAMGGSKKISDSVRLFMAPGMAHCGGGEGPDTFDVVTAMEQWVEQGKAPDRILASHATDRKVIRTRPLCPYPQVAKYKGSGSTDDATNFLCTAP